jgi:hypothetical protein
MIYARGSAATTTSSRLINEAGLRSVLPYFRKAEDNERGADESTRFGALRCQPTV